MSSLINIPTEYDADVRVTLSPETMIFAGALLIGYAMIVRKKLK